MPMRSIHLVKGTTYGNELKLNYQNYKKIFCQFFVAFLKYTLNFEHFGKKRSLIADGFWKLQTAKNVVT